MMPTMTGKPAGPGSGNFAALEKQLAGKKGITDPAGLSAWIGRRKYTPRRFNAMAKAGMKG